MGAVGVLLGVVVRVSGGSWRRSLPARWPRRGRGRRPGPGRRHGPGRRRRQGVRSRGARGDADRQDEQEHQPDPIAWIPREPAPPLCGERMDDALVACARSRSGTRWITTRRSSSSRARRWAGPPSVLPSRRRGIVRRGAVGGHLVHDHAAELERVGRTQRGAEKAVRSADRTSSRARSSASSIESTDQMTITRAEETSSQLTFWSSSTCAVAGSPLPAPRRREQLSPPSPAPPRSRHRHRCAY